MTSSMDDAIRLLNKWKDSSSPMHIVLACGGITLNLSSKFSSVIVGKLGLSISGDSWEILAELGGASFEYSEPREALAGVRASVSKKYGGCLEIRLPSSSRCFLTERNIE